MNIGVSTACLYPYETEKSMKIMAQAGFRHIEIFFNAIYEMHGFIFEQIKEIKEEHDIEVISLHPFTSFAESFLFFSPYKRRLHDGLEFYKNYFDCANRIGADILVIHGCKNKYAISENDYIERFGALVELGREYGVRVAQENVVKFMSHSPDFLEKMKRQLGDNFMMVFDIKQALRSGYDPFEFVKRLGSSFIHLHISDNTLSNQKDCLPPGKGDFDFEKFLTELKKCNFGGNAVIELYRSNFSEPKDLFNSKVFLEDMLENI